MPKSFKYMRRLDAVKALGCHKDTLDHAIRRGEIIAIKIGRSVLVDVASIKRRRIHVRKADREAAKSAEAQS